MDRKWRIEQLKNQITRKNQPSHSVLFQECLDALGEGTIVLSKEKGQEIYAALQSAYPFTNWGRIDWDQIGCFEEFDSIEDAVSYVCISLGKSSIDVFLLWGYGDDPVLQTDLSGIVSAFDDITAIGGDQWIFSPRHGFVIELFHDGIIRAIGK
ncbi:hypothetical protein I532_01685 [Brevibacillus borstelensis AK1]|uniref:Uncharacterized protein n=1 Tax=Brevibacillus borstelensis AK1 TaxID=1300222 RepID=M8DLB3_9BACL|nr:hypothetical protein [Brevibacillus borstelensis]EMT54277.1 hypothetical protein I532_01685 [Brevibacillus borstelensis AK1]